MKTIKLMLVVIAIVFVKIATAVEKPKMSVVPLNSERAVVYVTNENPICFEVSVENKNGDLVYYKQTRKPVKDYKKVYDFKNLAPGNYIFSVKVDNAKVFNDIQVTENELKIGEAKMRFAPYFEFENDELKLSYLNFDQENVSLSFYGEKGMIYEAELGKDFNITTGYDLSNLKNGSYRVVLNSLNNEFNFDLVK